MSEFLNQREASEFLNVNPRTLEKWRHVGGGPPFRQHGRRVAYNRAELLAWSESRRRLSTSDAGTAAARAAGRVG